MLLLLLKMVDFLLEVPKMMNNSKINLFSLIFISFISVSLFFSCQSLGDLEDFVTLEDIGSILAEDEDSTVSAIGQGLTSISKATEQITPENEYYIGRSVAAAITQTYTVYKDAPQTTKYLNEICNAIVLNSSVPYLYKGYYVAILDTDEINAMATPGGHIFVSRGLINRTNSEDALAAVIAHEIGHIQLKHSISAIKTSRITNAITKTATATVLITADTLASSYQEEMKELGLTYEEVMECADELLAAQEEIVNTLVTSGFSREQEFMADSKALTLMTEAGYDPNAMLDMLKLISGNKSTGGWNQTHPKPEDRIRNVKKILKDSEFYGEDKEVRQDRFEEMTAELR